MKPDKEKRKMIDPFQKFKEIRIKAREQCVKHIAMDLKTEIRKMDGLTPLLDWMRFLTRCINTLENHLPDLILREEEGRRENVEYVLSGKRRNYSEGRTCLRIKNEFRCKFAKATREMNKTCNLRRGKLECVKERLLVELQQIIRAGKTTNSQNLYMLIYVLKQANQKLRNIGREQQDPSPS